MSPNKTLYIREDDMPTWEQAEGAAKRTSQSVSQLVTTALRRYLPTISGSAAALAQITVEIGEHEGKTILGGATVGFTGRWLVEPDPDSTRGGQDAGAYWGVALTQRNRIAVYNAHVNNRWPAGLRDFEDLDEAVASGDLPENIAAAAAAELGQERIIWRDI